MFSKKYFSFRKWLLFTLFYFTASFAFVYFTSSTEEHKQSLLTTHDLIGRALMAIIVGFVITLSDASSKAKADS
jgi:hypothetical protein